MPLVSAKRLLTCASREGFGVPLFNVFELSCWVDFVHAAEVKSAPVIAGFYDGFLDKPDAGASIALIRHLAIRSSAPVALILDHGKSLENCMRALSLGFTDVMFDGSKLSFEENIAQTAQIVHLAHACGAAVEAELGHVGSGTDYANQQSVRSGYTDPDMTVQFVRETGVDFLAVAIGTAHGVYESEPVLDLERLAKIRSKVEIPLVLHGGTGLSEKQFKDSIQRGIAKVNVATDLVQNSFSAMKEAANSKDGGFFPVLKGLHQAHFERMSYYLDLFSASGKASHIS